MSKENGGPAFPGTYSARSDQGRGAVTEFHDKGLSLRDYFAAKALQGQLDRLPDFSATVRDYGFDKFASTIARTSYDIADAMIAARNA